MSMLSNVQTYDIKNYENVKSFFEHIGLYLGLVAYTAAGAKVIDWRIASVCIETSCLQCEAICRIRLNVGFGHKGGGGSHMLR